MRKIFFFAVSRVKPWAAPMASMTVWPFSSSYGTGLPDFAKDIDPDASQLGNIDGYVGIDDIAGQALLQNVSELRDRHAFGVDFPD